MNKALLMGRLARDPELKHTQQANVPVVSFTVAVDRRFKNANGERETDFISCVAWRQTAEFIVRYFGKGRMIALVGSIQTRKYVDKDGNNRIAVEVVADEAYFCGEKAADGAGQGNYGGDGYSSGYGGKTAARNDGGIAAQTMLPPGDFADIADTDEELPF